MNEGSDSSLEKKFSKSLEKKKKIRSNPKYTSWKWSENELHQKRLNRLDKREQTDSFVKQFSNSPLVKAKQYLHDGSSLYQNSELG